MHVQCFFLTCDLSGFKSRSNRHLLSLGSFYSAFIFTFHLFLLLSVVTSCLIVAFKPCMESIPIEITIKKNCFYKISLSGSFAQTLQFNIVHQVMKCCFHVNFIYLEYLDLAIYFSSKATTFSIMRKILQINLVFKPSDQ